MKPKKISIDQVDKSLTHQKEEKVINDNSKNKDKVA
tara:strand:+ start:2017 stop:2124 length:108 start_codon:yes stop_codon:yes gene_type:complete